MDKSNLEDYVFQNPLINYKENIYDFEIINEIKITIISDTYNSRLKLSYPKKIYFIETSLKGIKSLRKVKRKVKSIISSLNESNRNLKRNKRFGF